VYITQADGRIQDIDPATGADLGPLMRVPGSVHEVAPDDAERRLAVVYQSGTLRHLTVLDTSTGEASNHAPTTAVTVSYAPNGDLYGATDTGQVNRYDPKSLQPDRSLVGARGYVNSLQFSDDGSLLLATANDSTVALYDVGSGQRIGDPISSQAPGAWPGFLKPDGSELVVSIPTGIAVWNLDPATHLEAACRIAGRQLTRAEWATYLSGFGSYRQTCPD
jgi:WD40 repeat protein